MWVRVCLLACLLACLLVYTSMYYVQDLLCIMYCVYVYVAYMYLLAMIHLWNASCIDILPVYTCTSRHDASQ